MRKTGTKRLEEIWTAVEQTPGARPGQIARALGIPRSSVTRALPALDDAGMLLSEDCQGRLWPWKKK